MSQRNKKIADIRTEVYKKLVRRHMLAKNAAVAQSLIHIYRYLFSCFNVASAQIENQFSPYKPFNILLVQSMHMLFLLLKSDSKTKYFSVNFLYESRTSSFDAEKKIYLNNPQYKKRSLYWE